ncbi:acetolactate synthase-1/2/3 large subunit [Altererythrobacter atlanticus]|uniref:Acetolactate synthase large subunit n=1 Tax=Croceibacterium atlanticum TaxID=1267766 RepID=A0A0F7KWS3_9SPHN|nr:thiamine pyrophosphate-requiring protein [Croceibacterium atlanticum]AKH43672.1 Acetolactate synthase large subunit [Croceibacterium atlanticum]MBB5733844.1 acetolactate synthase-1/2/3 large subunit [Croceibacterium atlanticum]
MRRGNGDPAQQVHANGTVADAIVAVLLREGVKVVFGYPRNAILEAAARAGLRTIIVRQERTGMHMADAVSRMSKGGMMGVFVMQQGPGSENAMGGVAQAFSESVPVLVMPQGYALHEAHLPFNFSSTRSMASFAKHAEPLTGADQVVPVLRRAFSLLRNGRPQPVVVELPFDLLTQPFTGEMDYVPGKALHNLPAADEIEAAADLLIAAENPAIYAGQGVHWAEAYDELRALAEHLAIPVMTSLEGKSCFDETHELALGSGGNGINGCVRKWLDECDLLLGIGCSFTPTPFGLTIPEGKRVLHATLDPLDVDKAVPCEIGLIGDARLTLAALLEAVKRRLPEPRDSAPVAQAIRDTEAAWFAKWEAKCTQPTSPLSPYRVLWDLQQTVDVANTIITHDAGSPRDQLVPFWKSVSPHSYIGWGKSTQLGYGLGLVMGAKLVHPEKLCINVWGDAAIGFTGTDLETAARENIPILSILLNNYAMACELKIMPEATERFRATDISGDYANFARSLGCHGERVTEAEEIVPALHRALAAIERGQPALVEFITEKETEISRG